MEDIGKHPDHGKPKELPGPWVIRLELEGFVRADAYGDPDEAVEELKRNVKDALMQTLGLGDWTDTYAPNLAFESIDFDMKVSM